MRFAPQTPTRVLRARHGWPQALPHDGAAARARESLRPAGQRGLAADAFRAGGATPAAASPTGRGAGERDRADDGSAPARRSTGDHPAGERPNPARSERPCSFEGDNSPANDHPARTARDPLESDVRRQPFELHGLSRTNGEGAAPGIGYGNDLPGAVRHAAPIAGKNEGASGIAEAAGLEGRKHQAPRSKFQIPITVELLDLGTWSLELTFAPRDVRSGDCGPQGTRGTRSSSTVRRRRSCRAWDPS